MLMHMLMLMLRTFFVCPCGLVPWSTWTYRPAKSVSNEVRTAILRNALTETRGRWGKGDPQGGDTAGNVGPSAPGVVVVPTVDWGTMGLSGSWKVRYEAGASKLASPKILQGLEAR
ncbi:hypothetical protein FA15DRAFT_697770 [Coprinopsis marcescibilis]|uniref:Secreted protein n=1 Tax=Coprinopsis marcescibilis TaxID=230819 RepID=A0A5C3KG22_COPMA|nr:hypothetical protein FA15DRAFT_697770 [Coprinopsis marcescibilis]